MDLDRTPPTIITRTVDAWQEGALLHCRFKDGAEVDLADARENLEVTGRLGGGRRLAVLVDLRPIKSQTAEARAHFAGPAAAQVACAVALLIGSPLSQVLGNFFMRFNRPMSPTRLFVSEEAARAWLHEVLASEQGADGPP
jgi:hypothetical protein